MPCDSSNTKCGRAFYRAHPAGVHSVALGDLGRRLLPPFQCFVEQPSFSSLHGLSKPGAKHPCPRTPCVVSLRPGRHPLHCASCLWARLWAARTPLQAQGSAGTSQGMAGRLSLLHATCHPSAPDGSHPGMRVSDTRSAPRALMR